MSSRRKRVKPASRASDSAVAGVMPRVPRPAPPGSDSADDRHESTLMPYIIDAIGFFSAFSAKDSWALLSTSSQAPSSERAPDRKSVVQGKGGLVRFGHGGRR